MKKISIMIIWSLILIIWLLFFRIVYGSGESMLPTIPQRKVLLCMKQYDYNVGDIVFYQIDKHNVVHRIVAIQDDGVLVQYQLKGDGNKSPDKYLITKTNIKCKVLI